MDTIELLKRLYLSSMDMVVSEPDMPAHETTEAEFVNAMKEARSALAKLGIVVPELAEF
jgi:hypothetical protein